MLDVNHSHGHIPDTVAKYQDDRLSPPSSPPPLYVALPQPVQQSTKTKFIAQNNPLPIANDKRSADEPPSVQAVEEEPLNHAPSTTRPVSVYPAVDMPVQPFQDLSSNVKPLLLSSEPNIEIAGDSPIGIDSSNNISPSQPSPQHQGNIAAGFSLVSQLEEFLRLNSAAEVLEPIKFKDAVGRKFTFPWNQCSTWIVHS